MAGSDSPRLDAELLLGQAIGIDRAGLIAHSDAPVGADAAASYEAALLRRIAGEPVAYIRGFKEFHGLALSTDPRALIPRPETELIVDLVLGAIVDRLIGAPRPPGTPAASGGRRRDRRRRDSDRPGHRAAPAPDRRRRVDHCHGHVAGCPPARARERRWPRRRRSNSVPAGRPRPLGFNAVRDRGRQPAVYPVRRDRQLADRGVVRTARCPRRRT